MKISLQTTGDDMRLCAKNERGATVFLNHNDPLCASPVELFLMSLAGCASMTLLALIRKKVQKTVTKLETNIEGEPRVHYPKSFEQLALHFIVSSPDLTEEEMQRCIASTEEKLCQVWDMIRGNVVVHATFEIIP